MKLKIIFQPMVTLHFIGLLFFLMLLFPIINYVLVTVFIKGLGFPPIIAILFIFASLFGGLVNIGFMEFTSDEPIVVYDEIRFFGFRWVFPRIIHHRKTILAVNVGGAIIPMIISLILLFYTIPNYDSNPIFTYIKILFATLFVTVFVNKFSIVRRGIGVLVPLFIPVMSTVIITLLLYPILSVSNPFVIAYTSGTFGTIIGADILNLKRILRGYSQVISIGGAGTFDGIFMTGVMSILLLFLLQ